MPYEQGLLSVIEFKKQMINYMYTDDEIKKAGTDAGFSTHEVDTLFYQLIENKKQEPQQLFQKTPCTTLRELLSAKVDQIDEVRERKEKRGLQTGVETGIVLGLKIAFQLIDDSQPVGQSNSDKMSQNPMLVAGVVIIEGDKITIQSAAYIEDGWYIEIIHNEITLFEIPQFGGEPIRINGFNTLIAAIEKANSLT